MTPQKLLEGLKYLADQCPIDACVFTVPSAPACTWNPMRVQVSPKDITDLLEYVENLTLEARPW